MIDLFLNFLRQPKPMRYSLVLLIVFLAGCDYGSFDKDKRQIMAKDYVRRHLPAHSGSFDVISFKEDTVKNMIDSNFRNPIAYTLHYQFIDSSNHIQDKVATVLFTPDGHSIITTIYQP